MYDHIFVSTTKSCRDKSNVIEIAEHSVENSSDRWHCQKYLRILCENTISTNIQGGQKVPFRLKKLITFLFVKILFLFFLFKALNLGDYNMEQYTIAERTKMVTLFLENGRSSKKR